MKTQPKLVFVIVNKKNDMKFFQTRDQKTMDNPTSGFCIDSQITQPGLYEFYIQPQFVNMGTATPTQFTVIFDNSGMHIEELEGITYQQCYYYWNWTGAIRVPAILKFSEVCAKFNSTNMDDSKIKDSVKGSPYFI